MSDFSSYVELELPLRVVLIQGADATGSPLTSSVARVTLAPLGTQYLQDDVTPKILWTRTTSPSTGWEILMTKSKTLALILALG